MTYNLLPPNATKYEIGLDAEEDRVLNIPVPLRELWNPQTCPPAFLPYLAWGLGVDLWYSDWTDARKRQIIANIVAMKRLKGTLAGLKAYLAYVDAEIVESVLPPQRIYALPYSAAQRQAFRNLFKQLRLYPYRTASPVDGPKIFAGGSGVNSGVSYAMSRSAGGNKSAYCYAMPSTAINRYGTRAAIWDNGTEITVETLSLDPVTLSPGIEVPVNGIVIPAKLGTAEITTRNCYAGGHSFATKAQQSSILSLSVSTDFQSSSSPEITAPTGVLKTINASPDLVFDTYQARPTAVFPGRAYANRAFATSSDAPQHVYYRFYLLDQTRVPSAVSQSYGQFSGYMRNGIKSYSGRFRIKSRAKASPGAAVSNFAYSGLNYAKPQADRWTPIANAINASAAYRDTLFFTTKTMAPITFANAPAFASTPSFVSLNPIQPGIL
jgi:phage tail-like protein